MGGDETISHALSQIGRQTRSTKRPKVWGRGIFRAPCAYAKGRNLFDNAVISARASWASAPLTNFRGEIARNATPDARHSPALGRRLDSFRLALGNFVPVSLI